MLRRCRHDLPHCPWQRAPEAIALLTIDVRLGQHLAGEQRHPGQIGPPVPDMVENRPRLQVDAQRVADRTVTRCAPYADVDRDGADGWASG